MKLKKRIKLPKRLRRPNWDLDSFLAALPEFAAELNTLALQPLPVTDSGPSIAPPEETKVV